MTTKSLNAQLEAMSRRWPHIRAISKIAPHSVAWFGYLKGLERRYSIRIDYGLPIGVGKEPFRIMPVVRVWQPSLKLNPCAAEEAPLPHVYFQKQHPQLSPLCLFDPATNQWNPSMLIADTTILWTARWLACYEIWEATGRWVGGGRHVSGGALNNAS